MPNKLTRQTGLFIILIAGAEVSSAPSSTIAQSGENNVSINIRALSGFSSLYAVLLAFLLTIGNAAASNAYNDSAALNGLKDAKGVFMISLDQPKKLALYLSVIAGSHENFLRQNVKPDLKIVFIGASVRHLTATPAAGEDSLETYQEIARQIDRLKAKGVDMEVCAIATALFKIDNGQLLKSLRVVNDGFISTIGYQTQGYQLVPIY